MIPTRTLATILSVVGLSVAGSSTTALAQQTLTTSPDTTISIGAGVVVSDEDAAVDNQLGIVVLEDLGNLPRSADVAGLSQSLSGDPIFLLDVTVSLLGTTYPAGTVLAYDQATYSPLFDPTLEGVPSGVRPDAVSISSAGLVLSFDTTVSLPGGVVAADEDLVEWDGATYSLVFDGSNEGLDTSVDVDAVQDLGGGDFLVSFDTTTSLGGTVFADEDVARFASGTWTMEYDASAASANWNGADLDAVFVPEPSIGLGLGVATWVLLCAGPRRRASAPSLRA